MLDSELGLLLLRSGNFAEAKEAIEKGKVSVEELQVRWLVFLFVVVAFFFGGGGGGCYMEFCSTWCEKSHIGKPIGVLPIKVV